MEMGVGSLNGPGKKLIPIGNPLVWSKLADGRLAHSSRHGAARVHEPPWRASAGKRGAHRQPESVHR
jgi:hypothetical protein